MRSCSKSRIILIILICFVVFIGIASTVDAQVQKCITTGKGNISSANLAAAKTQAVQEALENAVRFVIVSLVPSETMSIKLDNLYAAILNEKDKFLISYKVLGEVDNKEFLVVDVESVVDMDKLKKELVRVGIIKKNQERHLILLLVSEKGIGDILQKYWWGNYPGDYQSLAEVRIRKEMTDSQFQIVPYEGKYFNPQIHGIRFLTIYDEQAGMNLAKSLGADLVIFGNASVKESSDLIGDGLIYYASIDVDVYDPMQGRRIFTDSFGSEVRQGENGENGSQAIENAAVEASVKLIDVCQQFFVQDIKEEIHFDLIIQGENFLSRFLALKKTIMDMPGLIRLQTMEMGASKVVLDVVYQGSMQKFANQLTYNPFNDFGVKILDFSDGTMDVLFVEK